MTAIHINYPRFSQVKLARYECPTCKKKTFFACFFQDWYGWDITCLKCGDEWLNGDRYARPLIRGWRKKSIEGAKRHYRRWKQALSNKYSDHNEK